MDITARVALFLLLSTTAVVPACVDLSPLPGPPEDTLYEWHTFHGSHSADRGYAVAGSEDGIFVTGTSQNSWVGPGDATPLNDHSTGSQDIFVLGLGLDGTYKWHTFFGSGTAGNHGRGIAADASGIYVVGDSDGSWDGPAGQAPLNGHNGGTDSFILKLGVDGAYEWHSYFGSSDEDVGYALVADGSGIVVTGGAYATWDGPSGQLPLTPFTGYYDAYVMRLDADGAYQWHTFYGALSYGQSHSIAAGDGAIYITATTGDDSWNGPAGQEPLHSHSGQSDALILQLDLDGAYQWHAFLGGSNYDSGYGIAADESSVYVTGGSYEAFDGPAGQSPLQGGDSEGGTYVLALSSDGEYEWHSFFSSGAGRSIAVRDGGLYVAQQGAQLWSGPDGQVPFAWSDQTEQPCVFKLSTGGAFQWHSFYGLGTGDTDLGPSLALTAGGVYFTASSNEPWLGPADQEPLNPHAGGDDISIVRLNTEP